MPYGFLINSSRGNSRLGYLRNMRLNRKQKKDLLFFIVPLILFQVNELIKADVQIPVLGYVLRCHFNDYLGGISFAAYLNFILSLSNWTSFQLTKIQHFLIAGLLCGICWELITPLFIQSSTGDFWDVIAYILGMLTYWFFSEVLVFK
ncbi:hypothetical protein AC622_03120 [Bacillus sp. FJAT-27916]|uniref:hypothetical protein n=1 Tax=Bacillus sp. FJAT-27916 TaxID=1679169 RepID=UPI0006713B90|nr:hypothetical protein [Bacillus sp. FJAT-27916]KMY43370.1 hypothetical protein AC622_03120 [Bacillus sp. FJAT-27916]